MVEPKNACTVLYVFANICLNIDFVGKIGLIKNISRKTLFTKCPNHLFSRGISHQVNGIRIVIEVLKPYVGPKLKIFDYFLGVG